MRSRPIPESWRSYRQRNRWAFWLLVAGFPLAFVFAIAAKILLGAASEFVLIGAVVCGMGLRGHSRLALAMSPLRSALAVKSGGSVWCSSRVCKLRARSL